MELHSGPVFAQSSPLLFKGGGGVKESSGLVCACGSNEVSESEFWWTKDSEMQFTCAPVSFSDEIIGSDFVLSKGVGLLGSICLSSLDLSLIFACLTDRPTANFCVFESLFCPVFTVGHVAQCPSCAVSVYP